MFTNRPFKTALIIAGLIFICLFIYLGIYLYPVPSQSSGQHIETIVHQLSWLVGIMFLSACGLIIFLVFKYQAMIRRFKLNQAENKAEKTAAEEQMNRSIQELKNSNLLLKNEIKERIEYEKQMLLSASVFENTIEAIMITDTNGIILRVNKAFTRITGFSPDEIIGQNPRIFKSGRHDKQFYDQIWHSVEKTGTWEGEIWNRRKDGQTYPEWLSINAITDDDKKTFYYVALFHDISDIKKNEELLKYQANYDPLTGLPNRQLFNDRLRIAINHCTRESLPMCLFLCDLDDFKNINDSQGHYAGDILLKKAAKRLLNCCRNDDTVARLGGDEFAIICPFIRVDEAAPASLAGRILEAFTQPFMLDGQETFVQVSIGITRYPDDGNDIEALIKNADVAMYRSKRKGKHQYSFYTPELNKRVLRRISLSNDLRGALTQKEFSVFFQPKADIATGLISGMEALMRWNRQGTEIVSPAEFIPLAEDTGAIYPLGEWILEKACRQILKFSQIYGKELSIAVNLSVKQFSQADMTEKIKEILKITGLPPHLLTIEITENIVINNIDQTVKILKELNTLGIQISIDDFGTGYSSLSYLKKMPLTELKVDKSFVDDTPNNPESCAIVKTVLSLAKNLKLKTVAEGVENRYQLNFLKQIGCNQIQGYIYCKPLPAEEMENFLKRNITLYDT